MADVEKLLVAALAVRFPDPVRVCTETPDDLEKIARTVQVARAGGGKHLTLDRPRIVLNWFAIATGSLSAREAARAWALEGDRFMEMELPRAALADGVWVTWVRVDSRPSIVPDANTTLRHLASTYTLAVSAAA